MNFAVGYSLAIGSAFLLQKYVFTVRCFCFFHSHLTCQVWLWSEFKNVEEPFRGMNIQLVRRRLSRESVKAYIMLIGIMGSKSLALLDRGSSRFSNKEQEKTNTWLCYFLPPC